MRVRSACILLSSIALTRPGLAQERVAPWTVERANYSCTLIETGSRAGRVALEWIPGSQTVTLWGIEPTWMPRRLSRAGIVLQPSPETVVDVNVFPKERNGAPHAATLGLDLRFIDQFLAAGSLVLSANGRTIAEATLPGDNSAVGEFRRCASAMLVGWGINADSWTALRRPPTPIGGPPAWFISTDYPHDALRADRRGTTIARLVVDAGGRATNCFVVVSSGSASLDARTCEVILARSRFQPALDRNGAAVAAAAIIKVTWDIPRS